MIFKQWLPTNRWILFQDIPAVGVGGYEAGHRWSGVAEPEFHRIGQGPPSGVAFRDARSRILLGSIGFVGRLAVSAYLRTCYRGWGIRSFHAAAFRNAHDHGVICSWKGQAVPVTVKIPVCASRDAIRAMYFSMPGIGAPEQRQSGGATGISTISRQWPSNPKPVTSVMAWTSGKASRTPSVFNRVINCKVRSASVFFFPPILFTAVPMISIQGGFGKKQQVSFLNGIVLFTSAVSMIPVTARPKTGSEMLMLCPRPKGYAGRRAYSTRSFKHFSGYRGRQLINGHPRMAIAIRGFRPWRIHLTGRWWLQSGKIIADHPQWGVKKSVVLMMALSANIVNGGIIAGFVPIARSCGNSMAPLPCVRSCQGGRLDRVFVNDFPGWAGRFCIRTRRRD